MNLLRKPSQDTLILVALVVVGALAAVLERGSADGFRLVGGVVYSGCVMTLGFAAWRSVAQRKVRLTVVEWGAAAYVGTYATVALAVGWPIALLTVLGLLVPVVVLPVFGVFSRFGGW